MYYPDIVNVTKILPEKLSDYKDKGLILWQNNYENFNTNIFSICLTESELIELWENLHNDIALYFQSNLEKEIELWNIYIIFFIENKIEQIELKYKVENDHYCARKIVLDNVGDVKDDEEKLKNLIIKKMFELKIPEPTTPDNIEEIEAQINLNNSNLTDIKKIRSLIKEYKD